MDIYQELGLDPAALELNLVAPLRSLFPEASTAPDVPSREEMERGVERLRGLSETVLKTLEGLDKRFVGAYGRLFDFTENPIPKLRDAAERITREPVNFGGPRQVQRSRTRALETVVRNAADYYEKETGKSPVDETDQSARFAEFVRAVGEDAGVPEPDKLPRLFQRLRQSGKLRTKPR